MSSSYEKGHAWYFSSAHTRRYNNSILRAIDWLGRKLSFLSTKEYETVGLEDTKKPRFWNTIKIALWKTGLGYLLGAPGAFFRWFASKCSKKIDFRHYQTNHFTLSDYRTERKTDSQASPAAKTIKLLTLNVACLPYKPWIWNHHVNESFLRANSERVDEIAAQILEEQPDIISFQEAFDSTSQKKFIALLKDTYPFILHKVGDKFLNAGSGLMVFSKYPIIEADFIPYTNTMIGEETIANKGFLGCKIQVSQDKFITVYNTHTQSGGGILKKLQAKLGGTTSARRGVEFGQISNHMEAWEKTTPRAKSNLSHLSTHLTGDLNTGLNSERSMLSISTGNSKNGFKKGEIKYPGQYKLFQRMKRNMPKNFIDIRSEENLVKGSRKPNDENKVAVAVQQDFFTGSAPTNEALQKNMHTRSTVEKRSNRKLIDSMLMAETSNPHLFFASKIVSFQNSTDHFGVEGTLTITPDALGG